MFLPRLPALSGYRFLPSPVTMDFSQGQVTTGAKEYNYVHNSPLNVLAPCFVGQRGSVNYHFFPGTDATKHFTITNFFRVKRNLSNQWAEVVGTHYPTRNVDYWSRRIRSLNGDFGVGFYARGGAGMAQTPLDTLGGISVNFPQFARVRFLDTINPFYVPDVAEEEKDIVQVEMIGRCSATQLSDNTVISSVDIAISAGPDFSFVYFVCIPPMYAYSAPLPFTPGGV
jgi:hypothetical protein